MGPSSSPGKKKKKKKTKPRNGPGRPIGLWDVKDPTLSRQSAQMAVRLSALRTRCTLLSQKHYYFNVSQLKITNDKYGNYCTKRKTTFRTNYSIVLSHPCNLWIPRIYTQTGHSWQFLISSTSYVFPSYKKSGSGYMCEVFYCTHYVQAITIYRFKINNVLQWRLWLLPILFRYLHT
jgi:hypothetical protein